MSDTIYLDRLIALSNNETDRNKLHLAFQSFYKRSRYAEIYFNEYIEKSNGKLGLETIDHSGNIRTAFEAPAVAFVANAHAMIDAFPYIVYLTLRPLKYLRTHAGTTAEAKIGAKECGWTDRFHQAILYSFPTQKKFSRLFKSLMKDKDFQRLRKMSNNNKHKFLTRIKNKNRLLKFEMIDFETKKISYVEVTKFFVRIHNVVLPKIYTLHNELAKNVLL